MADSELETTLRIRPQIDDAAAAQIGDQIAAQVNRKLNAGIGAGVGGASVGPNASTVSTAAPAGWGSVPSGGGWGASGAPAIPIPMAPGASTVSTAAPSAGGGGGGGGGPASTGGSGGGKQRSLWTDEERADMGRVNRARPDMSQYLSGGGLSSTARFLGASLGGNPLTAGIHAVTTGMGESLMSHARARAQQIEDARAMGTPESALPSMGMLRFAGPIGIAATAIGGFAVNQIDKGLSLQEQTSTRYAGFSRTLAQSLQTGAAAFPNGYLNVQRDLTTPYYGAMGPDAQVSAIQAMLGAGMQQRPEDFLPTMRLGMTGASFGSMANYIASRRVGNDTANLGALTGAIGAAQAGGLTGPGIDALLGQIASNTRSMAMRGVRVDAADVNRLLNRGVDAGIAPEVAQTGIERMTGNVLSLRDQALAPFKGVGDAMVMMDALRGARSYEGYVANLEGLAGTPTQIADVLRPGGRLVGAAYQGTGLRNDVTRAPVSPTEATGRAPKFLDEGFFGPKVTEAMQYAASIAMRDESRFANMQSGSAFAGQQRWAEALDIGAMAFDFVNEAKAGLMDAVMHGTQSGMGPLVDAVNQLRAILEKRL